MPSTQIHVRKKYSVDEEQAIMEAVHSTLSTVFALPQYDRNIRLVVHEPDHFACPPHLTQPASFTWIEIDCFVGRSIETKRKLYQQLIHHLAQLGIPKDHVSILIRESQLENWGIRGGKAASDVDLGFDVKI